MGIVQVLSKLQNKLVAQKDTLFSVPVEQQEAYLKSLPEPKDDIARGYSQYRCQAMLQGRFSSSMISVVSFPVTLLMLIKNRRAEVPEKAQKCENRAVFFRDGKPANIMPNVLRNEFCECIEDPVEGSILRKEDLRLIWELVRRYPLSWQFILKCTIKIARYRYAIEKYGPKALVVCNEYSFTSSVLTEFCSRNHVELINVMHGEKLYHIRDSFFRFHRCYVWDDHYVRLFERLRADKDQFRVAIPESLRFSVEKYPEKCYDYTYYMGGEQREAMQTICRSLNVLRKQGTRVNIRPHPRYTDMQALEEVCGDIPVENWREITVEMSVLRSNAVISQFSTVLLQACNNDIVTVIDDLTDPSNYKKLQELGFVMLSKADKTLSELLEE